MGDFVWPPPFRCKNCGNRFCGVAFRRRVRPPHYAKPMSDLPQDLPVLVYGRGKDEEPFREETNVHLLNLRCGLITLATSVWPGQQLVLITVVTVIYKHFVAAFVGGQPLRPGVI